MSDTTTAPPDLVDCTRHAGVLSHALGVDVEVLNAHTMQALIGAHVIAARSVGTPRSGWRVYARDRFAQGHRYLTHVETQRADALGLIAAANRTIAAAQHASHSRAT